MLLYKIFPIAFIIVLSCGHKPVLQGFDSKKWQADKDGCNKQRTELADEILKGKAELEGLGQNEITKLLGKPNRHELYARNKKAFVYFIAGGPNCPAQKNSSDKLVIRFDGTGRVKEIILYNN